MLFNPKENIKNNYSRELQDIVKADCDNQKYDLLQAFDQKIDKIYKESLCFKELSFSISDEFHAFTELTSRIANILEVEKCAIYSLTDNEYFVESPIYGQYTAPPESQYIFEKANEEEIDFSIKRLFSSESVMFSMLKINDKTIGILAVANKLNQEEFNKNDKYFLDICSRQTAIFSENYRLYRKVQAQATREKLINRINNSIRSSFNIETIGKTAVNEIGNTLKVSVCNIVKYDLDTDHASVTHEYNCNPETVRSSIGVTFALDDNRINKQILEDLKPVVINNTYTDNIVQDSPNTKHRLINVLNAKSVLIVPIIYENEVIGTISLNQCDRQRNWTDEEIKILESITPQVGVAMRQASLMQKIKNLAIKDELTGLINRRSFYERFSTEIARIKRNKESIALAIFDIDFFKKFNDDHGHLTGDYVLREVGKIIKENVRKNDIAARYGGEEFAIALPSTDMDRGYDLFERLRETIQNHIFEYDGNIHNVTISGGIVEIKDILKESEDEAVMEQYIHRADELLYKAKGDGRNQLCM